MNGCAGWADDRQHPLLCRPSGMSADAAEPQATFAGEVREGLRTVLPMAVGAAPFGLVFGAASIANGYTLFDTLLSSATIFGGASQFVFMEVNGFGVPSWSVVLAVFAVNFRHVLYSASIGRRLEGYSFLQKALAFFLLTDLQYAVSEMRAAQGRTVSPAYYFTIGGALYVLWMVTTLVGGLFGRLIEDPRSLGLDFLLPVYFLAVLMGFRSRNGFLPIALSSAIVSVLAFRLLGPPWHFALGGLAGVLLAAALASPERSPDV
jgi:4-azaleucine resistance transporter AzlC